MMKPNMRLTLLACALGAASIATAQTANDIPPPNDVIRLPGSVTTPTMPVVVSPPREDIGRGTAAGGANPLPVVRSLGSEATLPDEDTLADGAATGGVDTTKRAVPTGQLGIFDSGDKPANNAGAKTETDTGAEAGANSATGETSTMAGQNDQPGNSTGIPAGTPDIARTNAPANAPGASSGK
jgi:hypothetical protein